MGLIVAELVCVSAFAIELSRALSGNTLSWAYVFEWPILGAYAVYMWHKILHEGDEYSPADLQSPAPAEPVDPRLTAYNEYLSRVHESGERPSTSEHRD